MKPKIIILLLITTNLIFSQEKMKYLKVESTDFFETSNYQKIVNRLEKIAPTSERKWGEMTVSQMLHHLNLAIGSGLGYYKLEDKSTFLSRGFNQFMVLNVLKRFPMNTETTSTLKVVEEFNFDTEKKLLLEILAKAQATKTFRLAKTYLFWRNDKKTMGKINHDSLQSSFSTI
jgi:hypothetical protein